MRQVAALALVLLVALAPAVRADEVDDLRKEYLQLAPDEQAFWAFLDAVAREERDLMALMGRAREAEELAAQTPADKELRKTADALSMEMKRRSDEHDRKMPEYKKTYGEHMQKLRGLFTKVDAIHKKDTANEKAAILWLRILSDQSMIGEAEVHSTAENLFKTHPDDPDVRFAYAQSFMVIPLRNPGQTGAPPRFDKALETLEPLAKTQTTNGEVQLLYGVAASAMDKNDVAKAALDSVASIGSIRPAMRMLIGNPQDPSEAFAVWHDAAAGLAKNPDDAKLRKKRAELLFFVNADDRAIEDGKLALKGLPDDVSLEKLLVRSYSRLRRWDDAAPLYDALAKEMEKDDELRAQHAIFLFNASKTSEAVDELAKVKDMSTFPPKLMELLRGMLAELGKKTPDDARLIAFRLKSAADQGAFTVIWDDVDKVFRDHPDDASIRFIYAETCMCVPVPEQRDPRRRPVEPRPPRFEKAYELLEPLVKAEPTNKDYLVLHGVAACALGKDAEARKDLDAVASVDSCRPAVRILLGSSREPAQQFRRWHELAAGLADKPGDFELLKKRAELLTLCEAWPLAIRDAEAALKAKPDDKLLQATLGRSNMSVNHFEKAAAAFGEDPIPEAQPDMVASLFQSNRLPEFKAAWDKLKDKRVVIRALGGAGQLFMSQPKALDDMVAKWADEEKARAEDKKRDDNPRILLETDKGKILLELFEDTAPNTVANFVWLAENGFYDGVKFHRIIAGFMAQGGDPTGTGAGGPGYDIKDEVKGNTRLHWRGTLSMAKTGAPNSGNSQFFMNYVPTPHLNGAHTVFGRILEGQEVADVLAVGDAIVKATVVRKRGHEYKPETIPSPGKTPWKPPEKKKD